MPFVRVISSRAAWSEAGTNNESKSRAMVDVKARPVDNGGLSIYEVESQAQAKEILCMYAVTHKGKSAIDGVYFTEEATTGFEVVKTNSTDPEYLKERHREIKKLDDPQKQAQLIDRILNTDHTNVRVTKTEIKEKLQEIVAEGSHADLLEAARQNASWKPILDEILNQNGSENQEEGQ